LRVSYAQFSNVHWEDLDENISIAGLLTGRSDMTRKPEPAT